MYITKQYVLHSSSPPHPHPKVPSKRLQPREMSALAYLTDITDSI